jgi:hypothetical protein
MDVDPFGTGQRTGTTNIPENIPPAAQGTNASMHAPNADAIPPSDFGNTLRNRDIQNRICESAIARVAESRSSNQANSTAGNRPATIEGERPLGQTTPRPNEGFPAYQAVDAVSLYRGAIRSSTEKNFMMAYAANPEGTVVVIPFRAGARTNPAESRDICENAIAAAFKLSDEERAALDSLTPDMSPRYLNQLRPPTMPIMFTGLKKEIATALRSQGIWAVEGHGAFAAMDFPPSHPLETLGTLGNLTGKPNERDARKVVDAMIRRLSYHERFLNYVAMGAQEMTPAIPVMDHAINTLASIRVVHTEVPMNRQKRTCWRVYIRPPINDPNQWEAFREAARPPDVPTPGLGLGSWLQQAICRYCIGQDHAENTCPFKHVPGWYDTDDIAKARLPDGYGEDAHNQQPGRNEPSNRGSWRARGQGQGRGTRPRGRGRGRRGGPTDYY